MHPTNRGKQRPPRRTILRVLSTRRHVRHQTSLQSTCSCLVWVKRNTWENGLEPNTSTFNIQETTKDRTAQFERTTRCHLQPAAASGEQTLPGPPEPEVPLPARVPGLRDQLCCSHIRLPVPRAQDGWKESLSHTHTHTHTHTLSLSRFHVCRPLSLSTAEWQRDRMNTRRTHPLLCWWTRGGSWPGARQTTRL